MRAAVCQYRRMHRGWLIAIALLACAWLPLHAAPPQANADADPPARVARVAWLGGQASLLPSGGTTWQALEVNLPLTDGDELATANGARVELQLGNGVVHLAGDTDFSVLTLGDWQTQLALTRGTAELNVDTLPDGENFEIDTPQVAVVIDRSARVRVDLGTGDASTVTVRRGSVVVHGDQGTQQVLQAGDRYRFASPVLADAEPLDAGAGDAFDRWAESREMLYASSPSRQYVADGTVGYQDLDDYGEWSSNEDYGEIWYPDNVAVDWVPYRDGRWVSIAPWGMTWISYEPWGFAPFHYGRWVTVGGRWGWLPGPVGVRAVYAPALVGFFGGRGWNVSVGVGAGAIGWYPLGPGMIYNPWYAANWRYYSRVNRWPSRGHHDHYGDHDQRVRNAYNTWREPRKLRPVRFLGQPPHGITIVSRDAVARGHDVRSARLHLAADHLRTAPLRYRNLDITARPVRAAQWRPARVGGASGKPVVALRRPSSRPVVVRDARSGTQPRRLAPVRLLTTNPDSPRRAGYRPLPSRAVDAAARDITRRPQRLSGESVTRVERSPARPTTPVRRRAEPATATLPRVSRLQLATDAPTARTDSLSPPTRLRAVRPAAEPVRRPRASQPSEPRAYHPRPTLEVQRRAPAPAWRPRPVTPRPAPEAVRQAAPARWHPAPAAPEPRAMPFRAPSRSAARRASPATHAGKGHNLPPPVRWQSKSH